MTVLGACPQHKEHGRERWHAVASLWPDSQGGDHTGRKSQDPLAVAHDPDPAGLEPGLSGLPVADYLPKPVYPESLSLVTVLLTTAGAQRATTS